MSKQDIIYNHLPFFVKKYGCPAIWSTQGMEKSHYMARNAFFRHTQHFGGKQKGNSLKEVFQWFYRGVLQKIATKEKVKASQIRIAFQVAQKQRRRIILESSNAAERHAEWRKTKIFVDHKWVDRIQV